jgi:crotonobetainyl-CoA:carnitine CoA-transferase CaiB-like acyl-CoA transferase
MPEIRELIRQYSRAELIEKLEGTGLPFAPVGRPEELFEDPHLIASQGLEPVRLAGGEETTLPSLPLEMAGRRFARPAALGEAGSDGRSILQRIGYSAEAIERMLAGGAFESP